MKLIFSMKLAGMQTLECLEHTSCSALYEYTADATDTCEVFTNLATEGASSLIFFYLSQTVTNSHIAACWNSSSPKEKREGNVIFSAFVSLEHPLTPPKNSLSQRSRLLRIQH